MSWKIDRGMVLGIVLILVGLVLYFEDWEWLDADWILVILGVVFLAVYLAKRRFGLLVAGSILAGLGAGQLLEDSLLRTVDAEAMGLAIGFVAISAIALAVEGSRLWWPLVPGGILIVVALPGAAGLVDFLLANWPLLLVLAGVVLVVRGWRSHAAAPRSRSR